MTDKLPQGWCACKLSDVCILDNGYKVKNINLPLLDAKYLRGKKEAEYRTSGVIINPDEYVILVDGENSGEIFHVKEKGILGSTFKKISFYTKESIKYALYIIRFYQKMFRENKKGTAVPHLDKKLFKELGLILPPRAEQERIVEKIEELFFEIDEGIKTLKKTQSQIKQYRQSVLKSAFEGKLHKTTEWRQVQLNDICNKIQDGSHFSPQIQYENYVHNTFPYITAKNIRMNYMDLRNVQYVTKEFHNSIYVRCNPEYGDILLTKDGVNAGDVTLNEFRQPISLLSSVCLIKTNTKIAGNRFLKYFIQSNNCQRNMLNNLTGTAIKRIILQRIKMLPIPLPSLPEQEKIVEEIEKRFNVADELEKTVKDSLQKAEQLKQSILKKAFSGQLVSQDPNDEPASVLLERIKTEKNQQAATKKGRK